jgi:hypothetical protein
LSRHAGAGTRRNACIYGIGRRRTRTLKSENRCLRSRQRVL